MLSDQIKTRPTVSNLSRRRLLAGSAAAVVALGASSAGRGAESTNATGSSGGTAIAPLGPSFLADHEPAPLPFNPAKLQGLSRGLIESHWSNNYGGSVRALNEINKRLDAALSARDLPPYVFNDLKREHAMRTGSVVLHELYFANLGGTGTAPSDVRSAIGASFGAYDRWEAEFRLIAAGLGGGSGWVMLAYNRHLGVLENYWMADHMHGPADAAPLLVLDMYEHSYHMDYGAAAQRYVDVFFSNINWDQVHARLQAATHAPG